MRETSILIKPASSSCNCVCTYCFYDDVSDCRTVKSHGLISQSVWKGLVDKAFNSKAQYEKVTFLFQGGEPLLAGLRFFKAFVEYCELNKRSIEVHYAVQTNGTRLTDNLCVFFKKYNFLVGISIDGFKENHDKLRMLHGSGSFDSVMEGLKLLKKYEIPYNVLTVLSKNLTKYPDKLYDFYKEQGFPYVQIIPCMPSFGNSVEEDLFACTPKRFGEFYLQFFNRWFTDFMKGDYMSEGLIDDVIKLLMGIYPNRCGMLGQCNAQCVVESNGSIYPCDFYVLDEYEAGNIAKDSFDTILSNPIMEEFKTHHQDFPNSCLSCNYRGICNGNCKRLRSTFANDQQCGYAQLIQAIYEKLPNIQVQLQAMIENQSHL